MVEGKQISWVCCGAFILTFEHSKQIFSPYEKWTSSGLIYIKKVRAKAKKLDTIDNIRLENNQAKIANNNKIVMSSI